MERYRTIDSLTILYRVSRTCAALLQNQNKFFLKWNLATKKKKKGTPNENHKTISNTSPASPAQLEQSFLVARIYLRPDLHNSSKIPCCLIINESPII